MMTKPWRFSWCMPGRIAVPADGVIAPEGEVNNRMCLIEAGEVGAARH